MGKNLLKPLGLALGVFLLLVPVFVGSKAFAAEFKQSKSNVTIKEDEVIEENLYAAGNTVTIDGSVFGDVFAGANIVEVNGTVDGDLYVGGNTVDISGTVTGNVFVGAQTIDISGEVFGNTTVFGYSLDLTGRVYEDLMFGGYLTDMTGSVEGDARLFNGAGKIDGEIGGELMVDTTMVTVNEDKVTGEIYKLDNGSKLEGKSVADKISVPKVDITVNQGLSAAKVVRFVFGLLGLFVFIVAAYKFMPVRTTRVAKQANNGYGEIVKAFFVGLGMMIIIPGLFIVLAVLGLIFPSVLMALYGKTLLLAVVLFWLAKLLGTVVISYVIGAKLMRKVFKKKKATWMQKASASMIVWGVLGLIALLPLAGVLNWFVSGLLSLTGFGFIVMDKFAQLQMASEMEGKKK